MPGLELETPVKYVHGVGPMRGEHFGQAGVNTVFDLLHLCPSRYEAIPRYKAIAEWQDGQVACIAGEIAQVRWGGRSPNLTVVATIIDGDERCRITWFNSTYLKSKLAVGICICATGKIQFGEGQAQMTNPIFQLARSAEELPLPDRERWRAVYASTGMLTSKVIEKAIGTCLSGLSWPEGDLPRPTLEARRLLPLREALRQVHQPDSLEAAAEGRRRLAYDELLTWQLQFARTRRHRASQAGAPALPVTAEIDGRIRRRLPFELTSAQDRAVAEICTDLAGSRPMFRLLQGDVGCGKTVVAVYAALVAVANRHQVALLAPTEPLVQQHFEKISGYLRGSAVRLALSSAALGASGRQELCAALSSGQIDLVVGTHALLEPDVQFSRLGLVIIDEQHRFGVQQRKALKSKGPSPHYLVLSATPIPRTQALALIGDLDISVIDVLPAGPRKVSTHIIKPRGVQQAWAKIRALLDRRQQAYIVFPLVAESEKLPLKAVTSQIERLQADELNGYSCAMLHGRMKPQEKQDAIQKFRRGETQVLVCTTVVEVGVDIPAATVMAVFHAERYGLAQLHQLRGRVGRRGDESHFFLFADGGGEQAVQRLKILEATTNGFEIAAVDLQLRGPGQIMGTEQHGLPSYRFANLATDIDLLQFAQQDAQAVISGQLKLGRGEHKLLSQLRRRYDQPETRLVDVA